MECIGKYCNCRNQRNFQPDNNFKHIINSL